MKNFVKYIVAIAAIALATGCATQSGTNAANNATNYLTLKLGESTKVDMHRAMGQPTAVVTEGSSVGWMYVKTTERIHGSTFVPLVGLVTGGNVIELEATTFWFDSNGVLAHSTTESHNEYVNQWEGIALGVGGMASDPVEMQQFRAVEPEMHSLSLPYAEDKSGSKAMSWLYFARRSI